MENFILGHSVTPVVSCGPVNVFLIRRNINLVKCNEIILNEAVPW